MDRIKFKTELLLLLALAYQVCGRCEISRKDFDKTRAIITLGSQSHNQFLRSPYIENGGVINIFSSYNNYVPFKCINTAFQPPLQNYKYDWVPITTIFREDDTTCPKQMFSIGYTVNNVYMELYRTCYDIATFTALFSVSMIYYKDSNDHCASRAGCGFKLNGVNIPRTVENSYTGKEYKKTFAAIYNNNKYNNPLHRGHLAPSCDYLTFDQSCATFHYINIVPQFGSINQGNWLKIESWVRENNIDPIQVQTGAVDVLEIETGKPAYLMRQNKLPVPKWMYKLIRNEAGHQIFAIVVYNNVYSDKKPDKPCFCDKKECPESLKNSLRDEKLKGFFYCCDPTYFDPHNINYLLGREFESLCQHYFT